MLYFLEWDEGHGRSQGMEVEIREEASPRADSTMFLVNNTAVYPIAGKHHLRNTPGPKQLNKNWRIRSPDYFP